MNYAKSIKEYFENVEDGLDILKVLREIILETGLKEELKWGAPVYTYKKKNLVGLGAFKSYVGLWFFQGGLLSDPGDVLINAQEGITKAMRQWHIKSIKEVDANLVKRYIYEGMDCQDKGLFIGPEKKEEPDMPVILQIALNKNKIIPVFEAYSPYKQREFIDYINEAKQEKTKVSRLEKCIGLIINAKGLNDKYR